MGIWGNIRLELTRLPQLDRVLDEFHRYSGSKHHVTPCFH